MASSIHPDSITTLASAAGPLRRHSFLKHLFRVVEETLVPFRIEKRVHRPVPALHLLQHPVIVAMRPQKDVAGKAAQDAERLLEIRPHARPRGIRSEADPRIDARPTHEHHIVLLPAVGYLHRPRRAPDAVPRSQMRHQGHAAELELLA